MAEGSSDVRRRVMPVMGNNRTSLSVAALVLLGVVVLITDNVQFAYRRSTSMLSSYYHEYGKELGQFTEEDVSSEKDSSISLITSIGSLNSNQQFYILPTPEVTDWLLANFTVEAHDYYENSLNEDQAELWLYQALQRHPSRTMHPNDADVFVICGCLHLNHHLNNIHGGGSSDGGGRQQKKKRHKSNNRHQRYAAEDTTITNSRMIASSKPLLLGAKAFAEQLQSRIVDPTKPHLLAVPTTNPTTSRLIGVKAMVKALRQEIASDNLWSLGFERNTFWQGGLPPERIIPIPYVVKDGKPTSLAPVHTQATGVKQGTLPEESSRSSKGGRIPDYIFYAGDRRIHAQEWSGCDRSIVNPLALEQNMDIRLIDSKSNGRRGSENSNSTTNIAHQQRLTQEEYNYRMRSSEYCLILCGDSPTSRSLTSAMVYGCIPLRVGSRLRGLCEPPCHQGWGWTISGNDNPHLPYPPQVLNWTLFPEVDEAQFIEDPVSVLHKELSSIPDVQRADLRAIMQHNREGFIYGWGNPVRYTKLGKAVPYIWGSFLHGMSEQRPIHTAS